MEYAGSRAEMLEFIPASARRLLDVGCAMGRFGATVRDRYPNMELWGIDPTPPTPGVPQAYDTRLVGTFPEGFPGAQEFDCIVFNDVLEHMVDPWGALRSSHRLLTPDGVVVVSIPNVRHVSVIRPLLTQGRWDYGDEGILDRTHLRFFTRSTAVALIESSGFQVERVQPMQWPATIRRRTAIANRVLGGRLDDFVSQQFAIVARPRSHDMPVERPTPAAR